MVRRKKGSHTWVYFLWGINGIVIVGLLSAFAFYVTNQRSSSGNGSVEIPLLNPTQKLPPTSYFLTTLTPNPLYTPPVFETSTPFVLENGPRPTVIGFSLAGRPIEVYAFGVGEREYLIVAGIHGGYEWNTIELADELITHINTHPEAIPSDATL